MNAGKFPRLAEALRSYRKLTGLTQDRLARQLDITVTALEKWESGTNLPNFTAVSKLFLQMGEHGWMLLEAMGLDERDIETLCDGFARSGASVKAG